MFGIGMPELIIVLLVAFLLFGPQKLPELGRSIGKAVKGFRNVTDDVRQSIEPDAYVELDLKETEPGGQEVRVKVTDLLADHDVEKKITLKIVP